MKARREFVSKGSQSVMLLTASPSEYTRVVYSNKSGNNRGFETATFRSEQRARAFFKEKALEILAN